MIQPGQILEFRLLPLLFWGANLAGKPRWLARLKEVIFKANISSGLKTEFQVLQKLFESIKTI